MVNLNKGFFGYLVLALALGGLAQGAEHQKKKVLDIALVLRSKDKFNDTILGIKNGIETAKILFEKTHPDTEVRLHRYDHAEGLASALEAANQVVKDHRPAVIGGELSEESLVLRDQFKGKKIVQITPTSSSPEVTEGSPYTFRACPSDREVATQLAHYAFDRLKPKVLGIIHNVSSPYTDFLSKEFLATFSARQTKRPNALKIPIYEERILRDTVNFESQIDTFIQKRVTHVVIITHPSDFLRFVIQASSRGFFPTYIGADGWGSNEHVLKNLVENSSFGNQFVAFRSSFWKEDLKTSLNVGFRQQYLRTFSQKPTAWGAMGFDAAWLLMTAMSKVPNSRSGEQIQKALSGIQGLELVTHPSFTFGKDHSPIGGIPIYQIDRIGIHYKETLK